MSAYLAILVALGSLWVLIISPSLFVKSVALGTIALAIAHVVRFERAWLETHVSGAGSFIRKAPILANRITPPVLLFSLALLAYGMSALPFAKDIALGGIWFPVSVVLGVAFAWMHVGGAKEILTAEPSVRPVIPLIIILIIVTGGLLLRLGNIVDGFLDVDEGISGMAAEAFAETGTPTMPSGKVYGREILSTALIATGVKTFGFDEFGVRIAGVVFGTMTILVTYLLGVAVAGRRVGIVFAALMAVSLAMIEYSTFARMYVFLAFFFSTTMYLAVKFLDKRSLIFLMLTAVASLLCFLSHRIGFIALPIPILVAFYAWRSEVLAFVRAHTTLVLAAFVLLVSIVIALYPTLHELFVSRVYQNQTPYRFGLMFSELGRTYQLIADALGIAAAIIPMGAVFLVSFLRQSGRVGVLILLTYAMVGIALAVDVAIYSQAFGTVYRDRYVFFIMPLFLMLAAVGLVAFDRVMRLRGFAVTAFLALMLITPAFVILPPAREATASERAEFVGVIAGYLDTRNYALVGSSPELVMFYAKEPDYWLVSHTGEITLYARDNRYHYTRSVVLSTLSELETLEKERDVMVMMERDRWRFVAPSVREHVFAEYERIADTQTKFDVFVRNLPTP